MRIPRKLVIKGETWIVKRRNKLTHEGKPIHGYCDFATRTICIAKDQDKVILMWTFLHEFIHATLWELHIDIHEDLEEVIADGISKCLLDSFNITNKE